MPKPQLPSESFADLASELAIIARDKATAAEAGELMVATIEAKAEKETGTEVRHVGMRKFGRDAQAPRAARRTRSRPWWRRWRRARRRSGECWLRSRAGRPRQRPGNNVGDEAIERGSRQVAQCELAARKAGRTQRPEPAHFVEQEVVGDKERADGRAQVARARRYGFPRWQPRGRARPRLFPARLPCLRLGSVLDFVLCSHVRVKQSSR